MTEPQTALHLLPEDAYPFTVAFFYRDDDRPHLVWAVTALSPRGANPMELATLQIPPLKSWCGHEVDCLICHPNEFIDAVAGLFGHD